MTTSEVSARPGWPVATVVLWVMAAFLPIEWKAILAGGAVCGLLLTGIPKAGNAAPGWFFLSLTCGAFTGWGVLSVGPVWAWVITIVLVSITCMVFSQERLNNKRAP